MRCYVLDTHALLLVMFQRWAMTKLGRAIIELGEDYVAELVVPTMALVEALRVVGQYSRGKTTIPQFLEDIEATHYLRIEPLGMDQVRLLPQLEGIRELHDRIIAAHAVAADALLITPDQQIRDSGAVETAW